MSKLMTSTTEQVRQALLKHINRPVRTRDGRVLVLRHRAGG
jgi:hypothetical protein